MGVAATILGRPAARICASARGPRAPGAAAEAVARLSVPGGLWRAPPEAGPALPSPHADGRGDAGGTGAGASGRRRDPAAARPRARVPRGAGARRGAPSPPAASRRRADRPGPGSRTAAVRPPSASVRELLEKPGGLGSACVKASGFRLKIGRLIASTTPGLEPRALSDLPDRVELAGCGPGRLAVPACPREPLDAWRPGVQAPFAGGAATPLRH